MMYFSIGQNRTNEEDAQKGLSLVENILFKVEVQSKLLFNRILIINI